jgi:4-hydroxy-tetrahydrodipicolinate reductase
MSKELLKIAVAGCAGRMGRALVKKVLASQGVALSGGSQRDGSKWLGQEVGSLVHVSTPGALIMEDPEEMVKKSDAIIDFTSPDYSIMLGELVAKHKKILICGTTALKAEGLTALRKSASSARIVCSPNMSIGVNLMIGLVEKMAAILTPEECDVEIDEMHHRFKVDAPSGTALTLGAAVARGRNVQLTDVRVDYQQTNLIARKQGAIGFSVRRGGDIVGDHTVVFACPGERVELAHKATNRDIYATGAVRAALWASSKPPGFYTMKDVLGV